MIEIKKIAKRKPMPEVHEFMVAHGGNHVNLYRAWKREPQFGTNRDLLEQALAYALQKKMEGIGRRILGRLRSLDKQVEDAEFDSIVGAGRDSTTAPLNLDCLE